MECGASDAMNFALVLSLNAAGAAFLSGSGLLVHRSAGAATSAVSAISMVAKQVPHGGKLVDLMAADMKAAKASADMTVELTDRQSCDVELLCNGAFSPLTGFMNENDYKSVVADMKLESGLIFGLPVVMDTNDPKVKVGSKLLLTFQVCRVACAPLATRVGRSGGGTGPRAAAPPERPCALRSREAPSDSPISD